MAFPQIAAISTGNGSSSGGLSITLPSGVTTGERLLVIVGFDGLATDTVSISATGTGWVERVEQMADAHAIVGVYEKTADGDDALTINLTGNSGAELGSYIALRITGHDAAENVEAASSTSPSGSPNANPDAPNLAPSWGSADTLWIWVAGWDNSTRTISSYPTNYSSNQTVADGGGTSAAMTLAMATRELAASSENPGTATISAAEQWAAVTIAIKGTGGGDTTAPVLTSPVGTATGATTATIGATTDEGNGTLHGVVTTSATQPSIAQIKAGQDHTGSAAAWGGSASVTATGARTLSATGLTAATGYYAHLVHTDAAANDSNRVSSSLFTTDSVDTTAPVLSSPVGTATGATTATVGATTDEGNGTLYAFVSTSATPPSDADLIAGTGAVWAGSQAVTSTGAKTLSATGLTASTGYYAHLLHRDAAGNDSNTVTSAQFTTDAEASNDIRLQPSMLLERGAYAASRTISRWWVMTADLTAVAHTGTSAATNSTGQPTIDIVGSVYEVGDNVPMMFSEWTTETSELDRTTRGTPIIWVPAIAIT